MTTTGANDERVESSHDSDDESEDERDILEESPCGRWQKRRVKVTQRDVPGIDVAYLAMDTEEGVEVVWNEVQFSARRDFKAQEDKIKVVFDNLIQLEHPNIVKFHKYWTDTKSDKEKPRVIFITEYMSSGSLRQFLMRIKKDKRSIGDKSWKRWCTQILSALSYLHSCDPPIVHGNLTTDTTFIQHNGLIKIGSASLSAVHLLICDWEVGNEVAPDAIHNHVKTYREVKNNMHYVAPEYANSLDRMEPGADIYAFGICALEMSVVEIQTNSDTKKNISRESIDKAIKQLEIPEQRDFINKCLCDHKHRPSARELLLHRYLFEVHSLKLLSAHCCVKNENILADQLEEMNDKEVQGESVIAELTHIKWKFSQVPTLELEKFLEEVKTGIYPLTAYALPQKNTVKPRPKSPETAESEKSETPELKEMENRRISSMQCTLKKVEEKEGKDNIALELLLQMEDKMNRQLTCEFGREESPESLAEELVDFGFIHANDKGKITNIINEKLVAIDILNSTNQITVAS
ncbi:nuclear receptor-binding protein-like isoform X2 [Amphiura filiformis]|uniref:nuclear receptor-binding protein-like isoform X2 n=1 Tax=Amphiura filiformis TaxID=82378 RepID=UPI003B2223F5